MLSIEVSKLPDEMGNQNIRDHLSYSPSFIFTKNMKPVWGADNYFPMVPADYFQEAEKEGYATLRTPAHATTGTDYSIIWHSGHEHYYIFQIPAISKGHMDLLITPVFLFWSLIFLIFTGVGWYLIYDRAFFKEMEQFRTSLQYLSTGLYHENLPHFKTKEFQTCHRELQNLQQHISNLVGKYQYQQKAAFLGEINAELSHQVRNSLHGIESALSLIEKQVEDTSIQKLTRKVQQEVNSLQYQAENLLSHIRPFQVTRKEANLSQWIQNWVRKHADDLPVSLQLPPQPIYLAFDQEGMHQVFINLFENSRQACSSDLQMEVSLRKCYQGAVIKILDNGPGFPEEILNTLVPRTTKKKGSGLGIFICRKIVEAHNGSLILRNRFTKGAEIHIFLPSQSNNETETV